MLTGASAGIALEDPPDKSLDFFQGLPGKIPPGMALEVPPEILLEVLAEVLVRISLKVSSEIAVKVFSETSYDHQPGLSITTNYLRFLGFL